MRRAFLIILALLAVATPAAAQQSVVAKYRSQYPTPMSRAQLNQLLRQVAFEVHGGLLIKTGGNTCLGFSCDFICFANGTGYDVLGSSETKATPAWQGPHPVDVSRCALQTTGSGRHRVGAATATSAAGERGRDGRPATPAARAARADRAAAPNAERRARPGGHRTQDAGRHRREDSLVTR